MRRTLVIGANFLGKSIQIMALNTKMSEYELDRLERIKENQKMLLELFPEGTPDMVVRSRTRKRRTQGDMNSLGGTGSGSEASSNEHEEGYKLKRVNQHRYVRIAC